MLDDLVLYDAKDYFEDDIVYVVDEVRGATSTATATNVHE